MAVFCTAAGGSAVLQIGLRLLLPAAWWAHRRDWKGAFWPNAASRGKPAAEYMSSCWVLCTSIAATFIHKCYLWWAYSSRVVRSRSALLGFTAHHRIIARKGEVGDDLQATRLAQADRDVVLWVVIELLPARG